MRVLLINENGASYIDIENDYKAFNKALGWDDAWNTPTIRVKGHQFVCVCSDTGKLRHEQVSALSYTNLIEPKETLREPFIVGAIIITKFDGTDDFEALNDQDVALLNSRLWTPIGIVDKFYKTMLILD